MVAINSLSFVISLIFAIIYAALTIFSIYCLYKFFQEKKINKLINRGLKIVFAGVIVFALGFCICLQTEYGTYDKVKEYAQIETTEETVDPNNTIESSVADTKTVVDEEVTAENFQNLGDVLAENPTVIAGLATSLIANILVVIGLIFMLIGGFKKNGKTLFAAVAVFCLVLVVYSLISVSVMAPDLLGINSRFSNYAFAFFVAFMSAYVYVTNIEE